MSFSSSTGYAALGCFGDRWWQARFLVQNIKCPRILDEQGSEIKSQLSQVLAREGLGFKSFGYIMLVGGNWGLLNQCHAACLKWIIGYIFLSTQCLSSTWERLDCTDLGNKVLGGVAFKCSLHLPWDWWTSLKCPITPPLLPSAALQSKCANLSFCKNNPHLERNCAIKSNFWTRI